MSESNQLDRLRADLEGEFEITGPLGTGGMACVYEAQDMSLPRQVAIKVLKEEYAQNEGLVRLFQQEARKLSQLAHPNIIPIYRISETDAECNYFVMKKIVGQSLGECIETSRRLDPEAVVSVGLQVCSALEFVHKKGFEHRDIKPGNIMVEDSGHVTVMDFGISHDDKATKLFDTSQIDAVTPAYAAPEKVLGQSTDARSDIYALGITLYEALTGDVPFKGDTTAVFYQHVHEQPRKLRALGAETPEWLCSVVEKSLEKKPQDRYQSAREFAGGLEGAAVSRPTRPYYMLGGAVAACLAALIILLLAQEEIPPGSAEDSSTTRIQREANSTSGAKLDREPSERRSVAEKVDSIQDSILERRSVKAKVDGILDAVIDSAFLSAKRENSQVEWSRFLRVYRIIPDSMRMAANAAIAALTSEPDKRSAKTDLKDSSQETGQKVHSSLGDQPVEKALVLNGGGYAQLPRDLCYGLSEATVECWVKWEYLQKWSCVFGFGKEGAFVNICNERSGNLIYRIYDRNERSHTIKLRNYIKLGRWYHIAAVSGRGGMRLYVNGVLRGSEKFGGSLDGVSGGNQYIGRSNWLNDEPFNGFVAEFRVWDIQRTPGEIRSNMNRALTGNEKHLVGYWPFRDETERGSINLVSDGGDATLFADARVSDAF